MVGFSLVRVGAGKAAQGSVELVRRTNVSRDQRGTSGARMALRQEVPDNTRVISQSRRVDCIQRNAAFHISELPNVILKSIDGGPPQQRVGGRLQGLLVF